MCVVSVAADNAAAGRANSTLWPCRLWNRDGATRVAQVRRRAHRRWQSCVHRLFLPLSVSCTARGGVVHGVDRVCVGEPAAHPCWAGRPCLPFPPRSLR